ncbi:MAG: YhbY family RNA-binding protein [Gemmatimonadaceae bacterium]|nr:YhbY family RNA-binding protein [Gemmatimonadaceae bacterium]
MTMSGKTRAELRAECNQLQASVHVGKDGVTQAVIQSLDDALRTHELVKVALNRTAGVSAKAAAHDLAEALGAEVIQTIGKTTTLYRHNPEIKGKKGDPPPWRR